MDENSRITALVQPGSIIDPLTEIARKGAAGCWPRPCGGRSMNS